MFLHNPLFLFLLMLKFLIIVIVLAYFVSKAFRTDPRKNDSL